MIGNLNRRAKQVLSRVNEHSDELRVNTIRLENGATIHDFGVRATGGLEAGLLLARVCLSGLADVSISTGSIGGEYWPHVSVSTDHPVTACLLSQYAGWQISVDKFFAMGSGPMRAAAGREELLQAFSYEESAIDCIGVLESAKLPDEAVVAFIAERAKTSTEHVRLAVARTASLAGSIQVVARSVETALHKLFELKFDVTRIVSGHGSAPLPPIAKDDLTGIGLTNDAILYGASVTLWVRGDDESIEEVGPRVPASASAAHGKPFLEIFEDAGRDFYAIDPHLFSPARITLINLDTGSVQTFGHLAHEILQSSFGLMDER